MRYHHSLINMFAPQSPEQGGRVPVLSILALIIQKNSSEANHTSWAKQREEKKSPALPKRTQSLLRRTQPNREMKILQQNKNLWRLKYDLCKAFISFSMTEAAQ